MHRFIAVYLLGLLYTLAASTLAIAAGVELNRDRPGRDYKNFSLQPPNYTACRQACRREYRCRAWTYVKPGYQGPLARCWLKTSIPRQVYNPCCTSGTIIRARSKSYRRRTLKRPNPPRNPNKQTPAQDQPDKSLPQIDALPDLEPLEPLK